MTEERAALKPIWPVMGLLLGLGGGYLISEYALPLGPKGSGHTAGLAAERAAPAAAQDLASLQRKLETTDARARAAERERDELRQALAERPAPSTPVAPALTPWVGTSSHLEDHGTPAPEAAAAAPMVSAGASAEQKPTAAAGAYRFGLRPAGTPVFDRADWPALASATRGMQALMPEVLDVVGQGQKLLPAELRNRIGKLNLELATFAVGVSKEVTGTGPNGSFTHPAVIANLARATLVAAGQPLDQAQELALAALGQAWAEEQSRVVPSPKAPALAHTYQEVEAKLRFLSALKALLTPPQREVLFQPLTEGRLGLDLFSPALVYILRDHALAETRAELEGAAVDKLFEEAGIAGDAAAAHHWAGRAWLDADPQSLELRYDEKSTEVMFPQVAALQRAALAQSQAIGHVLAAGQLQGEDAQRLRDLTTLITPMLRDPEPAPARKP